jgi:hypothetical protein
VTPSYFWVQTAPPREGHPGAIAEGHYIIEDGTVTLTDVMGLAATARIDPVWGRYPGYILVVDASHSSRIPASRMIVIQRS